MEFTVEVGDIRLDRYIRKSINQIKQSTIEMSLRNRTIMLNNNPASSSDRLSVGDVIYVGPELLKDNFKELEGQKIKKFLTSLVLYEDERIMIINKPYGLAVQGGKRLTTSVDDLVGKGVYIVHRLDQHTTGALILAKDLETTKILGDKFKNREITKKYAAFVVGIPNKVSGTITSNITNKYVSGKEIMVSTQERNEGKKAITEFKILKKFAEHGIAYMDLSPLTGRKHQLRVHMGDLNCPILSDGKYGGKLSFVEGLVKKLNLHAHYIKFNLYGKDIEVNAPLPKHMEENLKILSEK